MGPAPELDAAELAELLAVVVELAELLTVALAEAAPPVPPPPPVAPEPPVSPPPPEPPPELAVDVVDVEAELLEAPPVPVAEDDECTLTRSV